MGKYTDAIRKYFEVRPVIKCYVRDGYGVAKCAHYNLDTLKEFAQHWLTNTSELSFKHGLCSNFIQYFGDNYGPDKPRSNADPSQVQAISETLREIFWYTVTHPHFLGDNSESFNEAEAGNWSIIYYPFGGEGQYQIESSNRDIRNNRKRKAWIQSILEA